MTGRARFWYVVAIVFTVLNIAGAVYAALQHEVTHCLIHVGLTFVGAFFAWLITARSRRRERASLPPSDERLENLQQSVDAIAIEVERIGEAQRFATKLQTQRSETPR